MRILQLIDSLDAGGAERIAVNYANSLTQKVSFSGLVTTRKEGVLKTEIQKSTITTIQNHTSFGQPNNR